MGAAIDQKASIMLMSDDDDALLEAVELWLDKWDGQYKIVKDHGSHNDIIFELDLYCSAEALADLPEGAGAVSGWSRGELTEDDVLYGEGPYTKQREKQIRNEKRERKA